MSAGHHPLQGQSGEQLVLLHRHWLWANVQRTAMEAELLRIAEAGECLEEHIETASRLSAHMYSWYSFLYALIEACLDRLEGRQVDLRGLFRADIDAMRDTLRGFRNSVFHVPRDKYLDRRLLEFFMNHASRADCIRRVHRGFGRLFIEEYGRRGIQPT